MSTFFPILQNVHLGTMAWNAENVVAVIASTLKHVTMSVESVQGVVKMDILELIVMTVRSCYDELF